LPHLSLSLQQIHRSRSSLGDHAIQTREELQHPENPDNARHLRRGPGLDPLYRPLGDTGLFGHIRLGELKIEAATRNTPAEFGKNGVICEESGYLHGRYL
jgi:hypothetical protein